LKRIRLAAVLVASSLLFGGCAGTQIGDLISIANAQIANPISATNVYQVKNGYAASLQIAAEWRQYCYSMRYKVILADPIARPVCSSRRAVVRSIKTYGPMAGQAVQDAETFVAQHPTLDASAVISAAMQAVARFRAAIPAKQ
jgi:hypothetical protein